MDNCHLLNFIFQNFHQCLKILYNKFKDTKNIIERNEKASSHFTLHTFLPLRIFLSC